MVPNIELVGTAAAVELVDVDPNKDDVPLVAVAVVATFPPKMDDVGAVLDKGAPKIDDTSVVLPVACASETVVDPNMDG